MTGAKAADSPKGGDATVDPYSEYEKASTALELVRRVGELCISGITIEDRVIPELEANLHAARLAIATYKKFVVSEVKFAFDSQVRTYDEVYRFARVYAAREGCSNLAGRAFRALLRAPAGLIVFSSSTGSYGIEKCRLDVEAAYNTVQGWINDRATVPEGVGDITVRFLASYVSSAIRDAEPLLIGKQWSNAGI